MYLLHIRILILDGVLEHELEEVAHLSRPKIAEVRQLQLRHAIRVEELYGCNTHARMMRTITKRKWRL